MFRLESTAPRALSGARQPELLEGDVEKSSRSQSASVNEASTLV
jgi:hypothetical protein